MTITGILSATSSTSWARHGSTTRTFSTLRRWRRQAIQPSATHIPIDPEHMSPSTSIEAHSEAFSGGAAISASNTSGSTKEVYVPLVDKWVVKAHFIAG